MGTRTELLSLLRAAKEDLGDAPRRLILADWLEEHGDLVDREKAEMLRGLVAGGPLGPPGIEWYPGIEAMRFGHTHTPQGFLRVQAPARTLATPRGVALADTEEWAWVADLTVCPCPARGAAKLVDAGLLTDIPSLSFRQASALRAAGATALGRLPGHALLRQLDLHNASIELTGLRHLLRGAFVPRLEWLDLSGCCLLGMSLRDLADAPLTSLRVLRLDNNQLREGPGLLAKAPWLAGVRELDLTNSLINPSGFHGLLACPLPALETLRLGFNDIGDAELAALAASPLMGRLRDLSLDGLRVTARGLRALDASAHAPRLHSLSLNGCSQGNALAVQIAQSPWAAWLTTLSLRQSQIGAAGADALAESEYLKGLTRLHIQRNDIPAAAEMRLRARVSGGIVVLD